MPPRPAERPLIFIDAGHGGRDPGAQGADSRESAVTLAAAQTLKAELERSGRYRVRLTRDGDAYVALDRRVAIARQAGATHQQGVIGRLRFDRLSRPHQRDGVPALAQAGFQPLHGEGDTVDFRRVRLGDDGKAHARLHVLRMLRAGDVADVSDR